MPWLQRAGTPCSTSSLSGPAQTRRLTEKIIIVFHLFDKVHHRQQDCPFLCHRDAQTAAVCLPCHRRPSKSLGTGPTSTRLGQDGEQTAVCDEDVIAAPLSRHDFLSLSAAGIFLLIPPSPLHPRRHACARSCSRRVGEEMAEDRFSHGETVSPLLADQ